MLSSIFHTGTFSIITVLIALSTALALGVVCAAIYMMLGLYRKSFVIILAALPMLVTIIIMVVNGNVGASVAVLGAFGLVRFRSAPGSARDMGFIFFSMSIGLTCGMGFLTLAALMTALVGGALVILFKSPFGDETFTERTLRITVPEDLNYVGAFDDLFKAYTTSHRLISAKTTNMGTMYELNYRVTLCNQFLEKEFMDALRCRNGNLTIVLGLAQTDRELL